MKRTISEFWEFWGVKVQNNTQLFYEFVEHFETGRLLQINNIIIKFEFKVHFHFLKHFKNNESFLNNVV